MAVAGIVSSVGAIRTIVIVSTAGAASDQQSQQEQQDQCQHHTAADGDNGAHLAQQGQLDIHRDLEHGNLRLRFRLRLRRKLRDGYSRHRAGILRHPEDMDGVLLFGDPILGGAGDDKDVVALLLDGHLACAADAVGLAVIGGSGQLHGLRLKGNVHDVIRDRAAERGTEADALHGQLRQ